MVAPEAATTDEVTTPRWWPIVVTLAVVAGAGLRAWIVTGHLGALDADEAIVGSMAVHMRHGHLVAFYWGQEYGGSAEPLLTALVFAMTGTSVVGLKLVPALLSGVAAVLVWRVARRLVDERTAQAAALLFWVAPGVYVWWATKARGFYWSTLVCGLLVLLAAADIGDERRERRAWLLLGAAAGVGWWSSPAIGYFAAPAAIWIVVRRRIHLRHAWLALPTAIAGASPWLWHNVQHGWHSFDRPSQPETVSYAVGVGRLLWRVVPMTLNLPRPFSQVDVFPGAVPWAYLAIAALVIVSLAVRRDRPLLVVLALVVYPLVYAALPGAWFIGEARYAFFLAPFLAVALAWAVRDRRAQVALLVLAALGSVLAMRPIHFPSPTHVGADIAALQAEGVRHVWLDYFIATRITFESHERVIAASTLYIRFPPHEAAVRADRHAGYAFRRGDPKLGALEGSLRAIGVTWRTVETPHLVVVLPDRRVLPDELPGAARP
jgi:4-amino-4-deoxy-L-arabinose transferase-like glycosyltransferase